MKLITYYYHQHGYENGRYAYDISESVEEFIDEANGYEDGSYIVVNVIDITDEQYNKWNGALVGM